MILHFYSAQPRSITISRFSNVTEDEMLPWGYFADNCETLVKFPNNGPLQAPNSVNCLQFPPYDKLLFFVNLAILVTCADE